MLTNSHTHSIYTHTYFFIYIKTPEHEGESFQRRRLGIIEECAVKALKCVIVKSWRTSDSNIEYVVKDEKGTNLATF